MLSRFDRARSIHVDFTVLNVLLSISGYAIANAESRLCELVQAKGKVVVGRVGC